MFNYLKLEFQCSGYREPDDFYKFLKSEFPENIFLDLFSIVKKEEENQAISFLIVKDNELNDVFEKLFEIGYFEIEYFDIEDVLFVNNLDLNDIEDENDYKEILKHDFYEYNVFKDIQNVMYLIEKSQNNPDFEVILYK